MTFRPISLVVVFSFFCSCTGISKENGALPDFIRQFHNNDYSINIFFDASSAKDSLAIIKDYGLENVPATFFWNLDEKKAPQMQISNNFSFSFKFPLDRFDENKRNLLKLIKPADTISNEEFINLGESYIAVGDMMVVYTNPKAASLISVNRFSGSHVTAYLDDSVIAKALFVKYKSGIEYEMTKYMIAHEGVQNERLFYYPQVYKDTVIALANFTTVDFDGKDTNIKKTTHLQKYLNGALVGTFPFYSNSDGFFFKNYYLQPSQFIYRGDKLLVMVSQYPISDTSLHVLAEFEMDKEQTYRFVKFCPGGYSNEFARRKLLYLITDMNVQYPYFILPASDEVTNITTGQSIKVDGLFKDSLTQTAKSIDVYMKRYIFDFKIDKKKKFHFSLYENGYCYIVVYDPSSKLLESRVPLWPSKNGRTVPKFDKWDYNYIFYFESNYLIRRRIDLSL